TAEELCRQVNIPRQAVWKHILHLRGLGYDISSIPHLGYQLVSCPDRLYPAEIGAGLHTRTIGKAVYYYDHIASTMDAATQLAQDKAPEGTVVVAETQTSGRGRLGRSWASPKYKGLYFSVIVRPDTSVSEVASITLMAAVSVCEAVRRICGFETRIKWPNDIFLENKKLGGILTEMNAGIGRVNYCVIGIGVNVNGDKKTLVDGAVSLAQQSGGVVSRVDLFREMLRQFENYYLKFKKQEFGEILEAWRQFSATLGRRVRIDMHKGRLDGVAVDIDADGGLLVRRDSGLIEKVLAGDVVHCR
ncbi:MAG: biotin--[acetyl-CoA-carboxylase] ligase, partial [Candidatus Omnitrophota bacterium]